MNEICHPEDGGEEVEATLDPMITGFVNALASEWCLEQAVTVTVVTRVGVCPVGGTPDSAEGLLEVLSLLLRPRGVGGGVY